MAPKPSTFKPDTSGFQGLALQPAPEADTVFLPWQLPPDMREELISYKNAQQLAATLDLTEPGASVYAFVDGTFIFGDFLEALIVGKNYHVRELLITALTIKEENVDSLRVLLDGGYVDALGILISDYNFSQNRWGLMPYVVEQLGHEGRVDDGRFRFAAVRSHCKIALIETHCGRRFVLHGSANLVSSGNVEQFQLEDNPTKYAFNHRFLTGLLTRYSVLNSKQPDIRRQKALTKAQTWQQVPAASRPSTTPAAPPAAKEKAALPASAAAPAAVPAAATTAGATSPAQTAPPRPSKARPRPATKAAPGGNSRNKAEINLPDSPATMKCIQCNCPVDERPLFRTNPMGQPDAGWMCQPCIDTHHDPSLIDEETRDLVGIISGQNLNSK